MKRGIILTALVALFFTISIPANLFGQDIKANKKEKKENVDSEKKIRYGSIDTLAVPEPGIIPVKTDNTRTAPAVPVVPTTPDNTRPIPAVPSVPEPLKASDKIAPADPSIPSSDEIKIEHNRQPVLSKPKNDRQEPGIQGTSVPPGQMEKTSDNKVKGYEKTSETGNKEGWDKDGDLKSKDKMSINEKEHRKALKKAEKKRAKEIRKSERKRIKELKSSQSASDRK